ncbi:FGGY family carbohydrate kinase [Sphingomonas jaspsi]|uniref:FGGY family carbohydrate kinase n=1 Tax=Sphingomonas jaspsi TaxID=392409 RepID=UPI0004ADCEE6|nr:glycerol kinase [Sphingomonas jaspsi]
MADRILVIDEGTTSTRAIVYDIDGTPVATVQAQLTQYYPEPGWVEQDASEIWDRTLAVAREAIASVGGADCIAAIGITNQRETVVAWDRSTGEPLTRAIVWQDRRTAARCAELREAGHEADIQRKTGLLLDPYFSASKMEWLLENEPAVAACDQLAFGTIDSFLAWKLTGGRTHATDASNASRTMLMGLTGGWDAELCALFGVDAATLPTIVDSLGIIGQTDPSLFGRAIPIAAMIGDQQSATVGQGCLAVGATKATFGTGAFILTNAGDTPPASAHRLLGTVLLQQHGRRSYALEGSIFVAGSLMQWLRDSLGLIVTAPESEALAASVPDNGGVCFVPALSGLGAPHWRADVRALVTGMTFATTKAHIVRAALEAQSHQIHDLMMAYRQDGIVWDSIRVDGGMIANNWLAQDLADITGLPVERPANVETTALGAAMLAAVGCGLYPDLACATSAMRGKLERFEPRMDGATRDARLSQWRDAISKV